MNPTLRRILRWFIPGWVLTDIENRLTHPYWRRRPSDALQAPRVRAQTIGVGEHEEKTSARKPFRRISREELVGVLNAEKAQRILDVGCGVGNLIKVLGDEGFEAHGLTINPEEVARKAHEHVHLGDIQADPAGWWTGERFDVVLTFDCLEHMEQPMVALRNINALLKPDGLLLVYLPPSRWTECDYHIICYTPRQFRWMLNLAGFDLEQRTGRHFFSRRGTFYYGRKKKDRGLVYPGVLQ